MSDCKFDPLSPKYQCCCGCHVQTGTKIISGLSLIGCVLLLILVFLHPFSLGSLIVIGLVIIGGGISVAPFYGINKVKPWLIMPFLIFLGLSIAYNVLNVVGTFYVWDKIQLYFTDNEIAAIAASSAIKTFFSIWYFVIVLRCYQYVREMKKLDIKETLLPL